MSIQALREKRTEKAREYRNTLDKHSGVLSDEVKAELDSLEKEISGLDERIAAEQKALDFEAKNAARVDQQAQKSGKSTDQVLSEEQATRKVFHAFLRGGERAALAEAERLAIMDTMSTTTDSEGGYTVPSLFGNELLEALKAFGGVRGAATVIHTATGAEISYPTVDDTANTGELLAENTEAADQDFSFGTKPLGAYKFSSKMVAVPIELLQDNAINLEGYIRKALTTRLGRVTNTYFTTGTGSSQPKGIVAASVAGVTAASPTVVTWQEMNRLIHSVDPAYRLPGCGFMFNDQTLRDIKEWADGEGRPLWLPGVADGEPDTVLRYRYTINQDVAVMAANAKAILFGGLDQYVVRDCMDVTLFRFDDSALMKKGQIGFLAFMRSDGDLMHATGACVKHIVMAAS